MSIEKNKDVEVKTETVEDAKSIASEMAKEFASEMAKVLNEQKEIEVKSVPSSIVKTSSEVNTSVKSLDFTGKLTAYKTTELEQAYDDGMWYKATQLNDAEAKAYCVENGIFTKAMSEGTSTAGGYTVPNQLVARVIDLSSTYGVARANSEIWPASSDTLWVPKANADTEASFIGENAEKSASDPSFSQVEVLIKKLVVLTKISDELIEDSVINMIDYVVRNMAKAIAKKEDTTVFLGDGTATYGSITGIIPAITAVSGNASIVNPITDGWANLVLADFNNVLGALADYAYEGGEPKWYCSNSFYHQVMNKIKAAAGGNYVTSLEGGFRKEFLGYEVVTSAVFPATDAADPSELENYCLFGRMDMVGAFAQRHDARVKTTQEGDAFIYNQLWIRMEERFGYTVHDQGTATEAGSMILLQEKTA